MTLLLLLSFFLQEEATIKKAYKASYVPATKNCEKAETLIESDPREAIELLTEIIDNTKVKKRECRLRIELRPGTHSKWYDFFPYQFRGRAWLQRAGNEADPEIARRYLANGEKDLRESKRRGIPSSGKHLDQVTEAIKKLENPAVDPEPAFRLAWQSLVDKGRFASARSHIEKSGGFLSGEKREKYLADTETLCRETVQPAVANFLFRLEKIRALRDLTAMGPTTFRREFALPDKSEIIVASPTYDWCIAFQPLLKEIRKNRDVLQSLFDHAVASMNIVATGENDWFLAVENLAFLVLKERIQEWAESSRAAGVGERSRLRGNADALRKRWKRFEQRVRTRAGSNEVFLAILPRRDFALLLSAFPVDYDRFSAIKTRIEETAEADDPDSALAAIEEDLITLRDPWETYSRDTRRKLLQYQIAVGAVRKLFDLKSVEQAARELRTLGSELRRIGGSFEVDEFGIKVRGVFDRLRR